MTVYNVSILTNIVTKRWGVGGGGVWQGQESSFQNILFSNHSAVKREQIIFTLETMKLRQESGISISFIDS